MIDDAVFDELTSVLEEERGLLSAGRAGEAAGLIERKLNALQAFEAAIRGAQPGSISDHHRRLAERVQRLANENARFLEAARHGIRSAISRLEGLNSSVYVGSYGRGGSQVAFSLATGGFNRKA